MLESIIHYASRVAMDIEGLGEKQIEQLYSIGYLTDATDIYLLKNYEKDLLQLERFGDKKVKNLLNAIENSKTESFDKFIFGLGIRHIGSKAAKSLAKRYNTIYELSQATYEELISIEDFAKVQLKVGEIIAAQKHENAQNLLVLKVKIGEEITVKTWPLAPKHYTADRDFEGYDENGEKVFKATTAWSLIDLDKRCLCSTDCIKGLKIEYHDKRAFKSNEFNRFKLDDSFNLEYSKSIRISDLDVNNHVNNTNYLNYGLDCLNKTSYSEGIKLVEIRFSEELRYKDEVDLYYKNQDNKHYVVGKKNGGESAFYIYVETGV